MPAPSARAEVRAPVRGAGADVLTPEALAFVADLHRRFQPRREALLQARKERQARLDRGERLDFLPATKAIREGAWKVAPLPEDLHDRRVEITGPLDRKMMINALNSGAKVFMGDFEDALSPTWENVLAGQVNLRDHARGTLAFTSPEGKRYSVAEDPAVLMVRPRGWHLVEKHVVVDGQPISASLFDAGVHLFHNASALRARGTGPYLYLPKLESHLEARLWAEVFQHCEEALGLPKGTVKCTVLVETLPAAFEMDEILHELRDHAAGLNAGRWDYLFSAIKVLRASPLVLPDRGQLTMDQPFLVAYADLLVQTCHRRGAHAIGGMAAFIPDRRDAAVTEKALAKVEADKQREARQGFDGTWVAHPDLVPVALEVFDAALGSQPHQKHALRPELQVQAQHLLDLRVPGGRITDAGAATNAEVALRYLEAWLRGQGAVAIHHLMEDAATAEISRAQLWQWAHRGATTAEGKALTKEHLRAVADQALEAIRAEQGPAYAQGRWKEARALLDEVAFSNQWHDFLTLPAYDLLE
jgi:malate synthase